MSCKGPQPVLEGDWTTLSVERKEAWWEAGVVKRNGKNVRQIEMWLNSARSVCSFPFPSPRILYPRYRLCRDSTALSVIRLPLDLRIGISSVKIGHEEIYIHIVGYLLKSACFTVRKMEFLPLLCLSLGGVVRGIVCGNMGTKILNLSVSRVIKVICIFFWIMHPSLKIFQFLFVFPSSINNISASSEEILPSKFDRFIQLR